LLQIEHRQIEPNASVVTLNGRIRLGPEAQQLSDVMDDLLNKGTRHLIFDLAGVTHIDSTGIGRFIDGFNRLYKVGGSLRMVASYGAVREAFKATRLDTVFPFFASLDDACKGLS
jgi:anti-sigma B factor antagonist